MHLSFPTSDAHEFCQNFDSFLASIWDSSDLDFIWGTIKNIKAFDFEHWNTNHHHMTAGASDPHTSNEFRNIDGSLLLWVCLRMWMPSPLSAPLFVFPSVLLLLFIAAIIDFFIIVIIIIVIFILLFLYHCFYCHCCCRSQYDNHSPFLQFAIIVTLDLAVCSTQSIWLLYFWFKYDLGQKYYTCQVQPDQGSNSWLPDHDSTLHVTETPVLTTRPSVTSKYTDIRLLLFSEA